MLLAGMGQVCLQYVCVCVYYVLSFMPVGMQAFAYVCIYVRTYVLMRAGKSQRGATCTSHVVCKVVISAFAGAFSLTLVGPRGLQALQTCASDSGVESGLGCKITFSRSVFCEVAAFGTHVMMAFQTRRLSAARLFGD